MATGNRDDHPDIRDITALEGETFLRVFWSQGDRSGRSEPIGSMSAAEFQKRVYEDLGREAKIKRVTVTFVEESL